MRLIVFFFMVLNFDNIQSYRIALDDGLTIELMVINVMINVKPKLTLDLRNAKKQLFIQ
jgi:hypothetical protein